MNVTTVCISTVRVYGRFLLCARGGPGFSFVALKQGSSLPREMRSLAPVAVRQLSTTLADSSRVFLNGKSDSKLLLCSNIHGSRQQSVRTQTTKASPATDVSEADKPKANAKKTQVLFDEMVTLVENGTVTVVDVREPEELQQMGGLPDCINIPLTKLKTALALSDDEFTATYKAPKLQKDDHNIVFYGLSEVKSSAAVEIAHKMGFKKSRHYAGGLEEWSQKYLKR